MCVAIDLIPSMVSHLRGGNEGGKLPLTQLSSTKKKCPEAYPTQVRTFQCGQHSIRYICHQVINPANSGNPYDSDNLLG